MSGKTIRSVSSGICSIHPVAESNKRLNARH
jgi:hypothetical protein